MTTVNNWLIKNKKTIYWVLGILFVLAFLFKDKTIELQNQSIFGYGGISITIGVLFVLGIIALITFTSIAPGKFIAIALFIAFLMILGGGALFQLGQLFSSVTGFIIVGVILVILYLIFKK